MSSGDATPLLETIQAPHHPYKRTEPCVMTCEAFLPWPCLWPRLLPCTRHIVSQIQQAYSHLKPLTPALYCVWNVLPPEFWNVTSWERPSSDVPSQSLFHYCFCFLCNTRHHVREFICFLACYLSSPLWYELLEPRALSWLAPCNPPLLRTWLAHKALDRCFFWMTEWVSLITLHGNCLFGGLSPSLNIRYLKTVTEFW